MDDREGEGGRQYGPVWKGRDGVGIVENARRVKGNERIVKGECDGMGVIGKREGTYRGERERGEIRDRHRRYERDGEIARRETWRGNSKGREEKERQGLPIVCPDEPHINYIHTHPAQYLKWSRPPHNDHRQHISHWKRWPTGVGCESTARIIWSGPEAEVESIWGGGSPSILAPYLLFTLDSLRVLVPNCCYAIRYTYKASVKVNHHTIN